MDKQTQEIAFCAQYNKLMLAMTQLGGHSRFLFMSVNCAEKINAVIEEAKVLHALSASQPQLQEGVDVNEVLAQLKLEQASDGVSIDIASKPKENNQAPLANSALENKTGFAQETLELGFSINDIGQPLASLLTESLVLYHNPHDQREVLRSSDETVISVDNGEFAIKGEGQSTLSLTLYKDEWHAGVKSEMEVTLTLTDSDDVTDQLNDDLKSDFGFVRPSDDFDIELELGTSAFIGQVLDLPIAFKATSEDADVEFESSDEGVFQVDVKTGAILPVAAGDAMLVAHEGELTDQVMVSIK